MDREITVSIQQYTWCDVVIYSSNFFFLSLFPKWPRLCDFVCVVTPKHPTILGTSVNVIVGPSSLYNRYRTYFYHTHTHTHTHAKKEKVPRLSRRSIFPLLFDSECCLCVVCLWSEPTLFVLARKQQQQQRRNNPILFFLFFCGGSENRDTCWRSVSRRRALTPSLPGY